MSGVSQMLQDIQANMMYAGPKIGRNALTAKVMQAIARVPRHEFVPRSLRSRAYEDTPLPIGEGQTISQPFIVALMTDLLDLQKTDRVLEIGTGSGYQAAVLAQIAQQVYSLEIVPELSSRAQALFRRLGYRNLHCLASDGYEGWSEASPFDAIIVTAACPEIPEPLLRQLKPGGRLVMPLGDAANYYQELVLIRKDENNEIDQQAILGVTFVPLTRSAK